MQAPKNRSMSNDASRAVSPRNSGRPAVPSKSKEKKPAPPRYHEMFHADKNSAARRCSPGFEIRRVERPPSGVTRSCGAGAKGPQQRQLGRNFCLPTQWVSPAGRHENTEARDIFFMALRKICNLESEAEAGGCRSSATARCWEGRSQRLPTPRRRLMACAGRRQPGLTLRDGVRR